VVRRWLSAKERSSTSRLPALRSFNHGIFSPAFFPLGIIPLFNLVCYRREEKPREKVLRKNRLLAECYCAKLKVSRKKLIINELLVEAAGVELITVLTARKLYENLFEFQCADVDHRPSITQFCPIEKNNLFSLTIPPASS
jgi:hypothetical protein